MVDLVPRSTGATKDITDDDQPSGGCGRFSGAFGCRRGEPDRDSGIEGGRGRRMGPIRDVLRDGNLLPPLGMAPNGPAGSSNIVVFAWWAIMELYMLDLGIAVF